MRLKKAAEDCKIALSSREEYRISLPFLLTGEDGKPVSVEKTVSRRDFEDWVSEKVLSTRDQMLGALADAKLSPRDLQIVLLVGGSTRIPCVKKLVEDTLGAASRSLVDPDLTVARGAAIQAGLIEGSINNEDLVLTDVCPYTLGTAPLRRGLFGERRVFDPLIPRNTTIPAEKTAVYTTAEDYQTQVVIDVYQGESSNPDNNERLGELRLTGIPPARKGKEPIEVSFGYDMNGILQVKASVVSTGKQVSAEINTTGIRAKPSPDLSKWEQAEGARKFRPLVRKAEKLIASGKDVGDDVSLLLRRLKEAIVLQDQEQAEELRDELLDMVELLEKVDQLL
jgi:molecular chaperone DnaK